MPGRIPAFGLLSAAVLLGSVSLEGRDLWLAVGDVDECAYEAAAKDVDLVVLKAPRDGTIADWTPPSAFAREPFLAKGGVRSARWVESVAPYVGRNVKGVVWIGPEGDFRARTVGDRGFHYADMLDNLVRAWRENLKSGEIPFVLAQPCSRPDVPDAAVIRAQMLAVAKRTKDVRVVNLSDLDAGERAAIAERLARAETFPEFKSCDFGARAAKLSVKGCGSLVVRGTGGWEIRCGETNAWIRPDAVELQGATTVLVRAPAGLPPITGVRYLADGATKARQSVFGDTGLPLYGFEREVENSPKGVNRDFRIRYPSAVRFAPRRRGVMLPADREITEGEFAVLQAWGVNLARYQIATWALGRGGSGDPTKYDPWVRACIDRLEREVLPRARKHGISIVVDLHTVPGQQRSNEFGEFEHSMFYNECYYGRFLEIWRDIARRFKGCPGIYGYDLFNEPAQMKRAPFDYWTIQKTAAEEIRKIDPNVTIIFEPNRGCGLLTYPDLCPLPLDNVIYQIHNYRPFEYTHQGTSGTRPGYGPCYPDADKGWDIDWQRNEYVREKVLEFRDRHDAILYEGEFSAIAWAKGNEKWLEDHIRILEELQIDWTYHAFRESPCWDVEKEGSDLAHMRAVTNSPRERVLREGLAWNRIWSDAYLFGRTREGKMVYGPGETMTFELVPEGFPRMPPGTYSIRWKRTGDDGVCETGEAPGLTNVVVTTSLSKPGFVRLEAWIAGRDGRPVYKFRGGQRLKVGFSGGAGVGIDALSSVPEPRDFDAFWASRRARLEAVPLHAERTEVPVRNPEVRAFAVSIASAGPRPVTGYLTIPVRAIEGKERFPIQVFFQGYGTEVQRPPATGRADAICFEMNAHGYELGRRDRRYYDDFFAGIRTRRHSYAFDPVENADPERAYFNGMALRVVRAIEYLRSLPEWNGRDLRVKGGSQGGLQAVWAAGLAEGVSEADLSVVWCCDIGGTELGRSRGDWYVTWRPALGYFDPVNVAKRIPKTCRITISRAALGDYTSPPSGLAILYNNIPGPKSVHWVQGGEHGWSPSRADNQTFDFESK